MSAKEFIDDIITQSVLLHIEQNKLIGKLRDKLTGKKFKIMVDYYDQPHGKSKPNLKGKIMFAEQWGIWVEVPYIYIVPYGCNIPLKIHDVKFIDEAAE